MTNESPTVYIVDDDESVCRSIERLLRSEDYQVKAFTSAEDFLELECYERPGCLILDVTMPGMSGLEVQEKLVSLDVSMPIIFITGNASIPMSVRAMKGGAINFIEKPFDQGELIDELEKAIQLDSQVTQRETELSIVKANIGSLTPRENEVYNLVITGKLNKQIAAELGISEKTIKVHRARVMEKMRVKSLAELVHLSDSLTSTPVNSRHTHQQA